MKNPETQFAAADKIQEDHKACCSALWHPATDLGYIHQCKVEILAEAEVVRRVGRSIFWMK